MGAFNGELYALGYRFNTASNKEVVQTPDQLAKRGFQETLHVAAYPCVGSCGQRCPNHHCNAHNVKDSLVPVSWAMYKEVCGKYDPIK